MYKDKVAVIMSVYKSDNPIDFNVAVNSIIRQTLKCDIFIYQDGPVSRELKSAINRFRKFNNIFIFVSEENKGLAYALNYLIDSCLLNNYQYIARMDSDDISHKNRMSIQVNFLEDNSDIHVVGSYCKEFGADCSLAEKKLPITHNDLLNFSITRCPFIHPSVMFRTSIFYNGLRYPVNTKYTEDMAFWFILLDLGYKFENIPETLIDYRMTENTVLRRRGFDKALSEVFIRFKYMIKFKKITVKNVSFIIGRFVFHLLPPNAIKYLYKKMR
ncbi:glycosyltransferase [Aliivibrio fischeri ES114]|uniref:Glycosyltransferase n=1 Tax=Aliivibrio fischeri (strain ATCC 700601 / ES114) TaxID=312309 RepID=Q5E8H6_ALIF1|nr:glycosyltransferase [Aliivibrio fischeri]AAW84670.1 glycosyltransferase [Aliivibrio fischeri ES114]